MILLRNIPVFSVCTFSYRRYPQPRDVRLGCAAARLLILWVQIPPVALMSVFIECCVLSGRFIYCHWPITRTEYSYRVSCIYEYTIQNLQNEEDLTHWGCRAKRKNIQFQHELIPHLWLTSFSSLSQIPKCLEIIRNILAITSNYLKYLRTQLLYSRPVFENILANNIHSTQHS